jgi:hypothetical protein
MHLCQHRTPAHGYEPTREAAMAAFAKSWRRRGHVHVRLERSKASALARNSARSFSAETERAASRHFFAKHRYSSGFFVVEAMQKAWPCK